MAAPSEPNSSNAATLAQRLGAAVASATWETIDGAAVDKAKLCILDYLSCALASHELPWSQQAAAVARKNTGRDPGTDATVIGTAQRVAAHDAAFSNAVLGHALVRDDMHIGSVSHLAVVVMPTLFAIAEEPAPGSGPDGRSLLTAIVCGYEIGGRIGRAILDVDVARIFRPTGIAGPIGAAAAAARLLGLDAAATANAIGIAANTVAGYNEWAGTGGSEMFFHVGFAARNAVTAAQLAAAGAYSSPTALDGPAGLLAAFGKRSAPAVQEAFRDGPEILSVFFKPVPACNYAQSPAQAAQTIATVHAPRAADIDSVAVRVTRAAAAYPGCDVAGSFEHVLQAKMSIQYNVAAALVHGNFAEANYVPQQQPDVLRLAGVTRLEADDELTAAYPARQGAEVIVRMADGTEHRQRVEDIVPSSDDEVRARFRAAADERLGRMKAERLLELVETLETEEDAATLVALTRSGELK